MVATIRHLRLVEDTENFIQMVVDLTAEQRYLHDDAVMHQTLYEGVGDSFLHLIAIIVVGFVVDVDNRHLNIPHPMSEEINGHHGYGKAIVAVMANIAFITVLCAQVLPEAQRLRLQPCLLQLYKDEMLAAVALPDGSREVDTKHGNLVTRLIGVFVWTRLDAHDIFLQQC